MSLSIRCEICLARVDPLTLYRTIPRSSVGLLVQGARHHSLSRRRLQEGCRSNHRRARARHQQGVRVTTLMTEDDLKRGGELAVQLFPLLTGERSPAAITAAAILLASLSTIAKCGPAAPVKLFRSYYEQCGGPPVDIDAIRLRLIAALCADPIFNPGNAPHVSVRLATLSPDELRATLDPLIRACDPEPMP